MGCGFEEKIVDLVKGALDAGEAAGIEAHLASCEDCAEIAAGYRNVLAAFSLVEDVEPSDGFTDRLREDISAGCAFSQMAVDYTRGELYGKTASDFSAHLADCPVCAREVAAFKAVLSKAAGIGSIEASETFASKVMARVREAEARVEEHPAEEPAYARIGAAVEDIEPSPGFALRVMARVREILRAERLAGAAEPGPRILKFFNPDRLASLAASAAMHLAIITAGFYMWLNLVPVVAGEDPMGQFAHLSRYTLREPKVVISPVIPPDTNDGDGTPDYNIPSSFEDYEAAAGDAIPPELPPSASRYGETLGMGDVPDLDPVLMGAKLYPENDLARSRIVGPRSVVLGYLGGRGTDPYVYAGFKWLAENQSEDGSWRAGDFGGEREATLGVTGLAAMAYLGRGFTHNSGIYADRVESAINYIISKQDGDGFFGGSGSEQYDIYTHAICVIVLAEDLALSGDEDLLEKPLARAVAALEGAQRPDGSWGYAHEGIPALGDSSITSWCLAAFYAVKYTDVRYSESAVKRGLAYIRSVTDLATGTVYYEKTGESHGVPTLGNRGITAAAMFAFQTLTEGRFEGLLKKQAKLALEEPPVKGNWLTNDLYYWYFASLALIRGDRSDWLAWNEDMKSAVIGGFVDLSESDDEPYGYFEDDTRWSRRGGRVYTTAMSVLILETYYRFPIEMKKPFVEPTEDSEDE